MMNRDGILCSAREFHAFNFLDTGALFGLFRNEQVSLFISQQGKDSIVNGISPTTQHTVTVPSSPQPQVHDEKNDDEP